MPKGHYCGTFRELSDGACVRVEAPLRLEHDPSLGSDPDALDPRRLPPLPAGTVIPVLYKPDAEHTESRRVTFVALLDRQASEHYRYTELYTFRDEECR